VSFVAIAGLAMSVGCSSSNKSNQVAGTASPVVKEVPSVAKVASEVKKEIALPLFGRIHMFKTPDVSLEDNKDTRVTVNKYRTLLLEQMYVQREYIDAVAITKNALVKVNTANQSLIDARSQGERDAIDAAIADLHDARTAQSEAREIMNDRKARLNTIGLDIEALESRTRIAGHILEIESIERRFDIRNNKKRAFVEMRIRGVEDVIVLEEVVDGKLMFEGLLENEPFVVDVVEVAADGTSENMTDHLAEDSASFTGTVVIKGNTEIAEFTGIIIADLRQDEQPDVDGFTERLTHLSKNRELIRIQARLNQMDERIDNLEDSIRAELAAHGTRLESLESSVELLQAITDKHENTINKDLLPAIKRIDGAIESLQTQINDRVTKEELAQARKEDFDRIKSEFLDKLRADLTALDEKLTKLITEDMPAFVAARLEAAAKPVLEKITSLETRITVLEGQVGDKVSNDQLVALRGELEGIRGQLTTVDQAVQGKLDKTAVEDIKTSVITTIVEGELDPIKDRLEKAETGIRTLEGQVQSHAALHVDKVIADALAESGLSDVGTRLAGRLDEMLASAEGAGNGALVDGLRELQGKFTATASEDKAASVKNRVQAEFAGKPIDLERVKAIAAEEAARIIETYRQIDEGATELAKEHGGDQAEDQPAEGEEK
jgi:hypothetical protein